MAAQSDVLITGCSSGIGAALADEFHARGHKVYATARKPEALAPLAARGLRTLALDVTDAAPVVVRGGAHSFRLPFLKRWLPTRVVDRKLSKMFGLDRQ